jgi:dipeptidyl aminopeptidase/acylaminoacyl peptidase
VAEPFPVVRSAVTFFAPFEPDESRDRLRRASPLTHVTATSAPLLMVAGSRDAMRPLAQARRMAAALEAAGVVHQLLVVDGATHEDDAFHSPAVLGAVAGWLASY